ncbi:MAG TPA: crossover junction endodeoxyribonuclease RuvC, partial [Nitrospiria bacterium]|nr:crossover junction endodeoxyribonuclease RuvC [Nitrospiria bacterium]
HGIALLVAQQAGLPVFEFNPTHVKQAVVGYGAARKQQVSEMVTRLLELDRFPETHHAADALAVAICTIHSEPLRRLSEAADEGGEGRPSRGRKGSGRRWTSLPKGRSKIL